MTTHLGLQRIMIPSAQVSQLTTGSITLPSARQSIGSAFEAIQSIEVSSSTSSVAFNSIPQNYKHLQLRICAITNRATYNYDSHRITFNSITSNSYDYRAMNNDPSGGGSLQAVASQSTRFFTPLAGTQVKNNMGFTIMDIYDYADTSNYKSVYFIGGSDSNGSDGGYRSYTLIGNGTLADTQAVSQITIQADAGQYQAPSTFSLYGVRA